VSGGFGAVRTDRLDLRPFQESDVDGLAAVFAKPEVWHFPYGRGLDRRETAEFIQRQRREWDTAGFGLWVARLRASGEVIGFVGLSVPTFLPEILPAVEVGWRFDPTCWGQGLATEGARAALREGFGVLGLAEICSLPQSVNPASWRVCERLGMRFVREVVCPATDRRGPVDARLYVATAAVG
jgi:RimJ/RimL family protein N-acetyltransferase